MQRRDSSVLTDRYLAAVQSYLPADVSADIVAELSDSIHSAVEEREAALGRPLTVDEESGVLRPYGPPVLVASRYRSHEQLIGPLLLPYYWNTLRIVLWFVLALNVVAFFTGLTTHGDALRAFARTWGAAAISVLIAGAVVTLVFALIERFGNPAVMIERWNPRTLPRGGAAQSVPRASSAAELVCNIIFVVWILAVPAIRSWLSAIVAAAPPAPVPAESPLQLGGAWAWEAAAILVVALVNASLNVVNLIRPELARLRAATLTFTNAFLAAVSIFVLFQRPLVLTGGHAAAAEAAALEGVAVWSVACFAVGLIVAAIVYLRAFLRLSGPSSIATSRFGATAR